MDAERKAEAVANLAKLIALGDTVFLIRRAKGRTTRNQIIDVRLQRAPQATLAAELIGTITNRPYIYHRSGLLVKRQDDPEQMIHDVSIELFGEPGRIRMIWI